MERMVKYDRDDNLIEQSYQNEDGSIAEKCLYRYKESKMIEAKWFRNGINMSERKALKYDNNGNNIKTTVYGFDDKIISSTIIKYNKDKKIVVEITTKDNVITNSIIYKYNKNGQLSDEIYCGQITYDNKEEAIADNLPFESYQHTRYEYTTIVKKIITTERSVDIDNIDTETYIE